MDDLLGGVPAALHRECSFLAHLPGQESSHKGRTEHTGSCHEEDPIEHHSVRDPAGAATEAVDLRRGGINGSIRSHIASGIRNTPAIATGTEAADVSLAGSRSS